VIGRANPSEPLLPQIQTQSG